MKLDEPSPGEPLPAPPEPEVEEPPPVESQGSVDELEMEEPSDLTEAPELLPSSGLPGGVVGGGVAAGPPSSAGTPPRLLSAVPPCQFPPQATAAGVDSGRVAVRVTVAVDGRVARVRVGNDPGHGFGLAARDCARLMKFEPGRDSQGRPITTIVTIVVRFAAK